MTNHPVFIVGIARSGTTLLAAMLSSHSKMACGPETHFFRHLSQVEPTRLVSGKDWPEPARDFILSISHTNYSSPDRTQLIDKYQLSESEILEYLKSKPPSIDTIISSITDQYARKSGKTRWIEKTPDHIEQVELIRKYFPNSPIIRIVRDPRDVALSIKKVPWGAESFIHGLILWKQLDLASENFFSNDQLSYTVHYEGLLNSPREELVKICKFIGETFEENMLQTTQAGKQLNSRKVPWKTKASQPIDKSRNQVWRSELSTLEKQIADTFVGDRIVTHGYELDESLRTAGELFPSYTLIPKYIDKLSFLFDDSVRLWSLDDGEETSALVLLGDPRGDHWFSDSRTGSTFEAFSLVRKILRYKIKRKSIYWIHDETDPGWTGYIAFIIRKLLAPYAISVA